MVPAGQPFGEVMDLHGRVVERCVEDHDVQVIAIRHDPVVHTGDRVAYLAHAWKDVPVG
jgi:hypothetical protein